jgi:hypothetical protein
MIRSAALLAAASLAFLLAPVSSPVTAAPTPPGPGAVIGMHERFFRAIDAGELDKALAFLHADMNLDQQERARPCSLFLVDRAGVPRQATSFEASKKLLGEWIRTWTPAGSKCETRVTPIGADCFSAELSYAVLQLERKVTVGEKTTTQRYLCTSLVTHGGNDGWQLTHCHLSPGQADSASGVATK